MNSFSAPPEQSGRWVTGQSGDIGKGLGRQAVGSQRIGSALTGAGEAR